MTIRARSAPLLVMIALGGALVTACSAQDADPAARTTGSTRMAAALPVPDAGRGGVTGMPDLPGPGAIGTPVPDQGREIEYLDSAADLDGTPEEHEAISRAEQSIDVYEAPDASEEPGAHEAVATLREYYAALDNGSFARAYRSWSDGGAATGQSLQQFTDSFAGMAAQSVEFMTPGRIDVAAGSRYIEVPVMIEAIRRDGRVHRYAGAYTLRRAIADDASAGQRAWRIISADLREVRP